MNSNLKAVLGLLSLIAIFLLVGKLTSVPITSVSHAESSVDNSARRVLGPLATINEGESGLDFVARVDTGAKTCSMHTAEKQVLEGSKFMEDNVGKTVRFLIENRQGQEQWLERTISEVRKIRTSEGEEMRYLVPMELSCNGIEREVLVSLNDRSRMTYNMLLGRNFLAGEFMVDVTGADDEVELLASDL